MATSAINVVSAPAPVASVPGGAAVTQEGPSFKDLLAGAEASATAGESAPIPQEGALATDDGGEESPPDGNPLPLASPLLPPAETAVLNALPAIEEGPALPAAAADAPVPVTATIVKPAEADAPALPVDLLPAQTAKDSAAKATPEAASAAPVPPPVSQKPVQPQQTTEQASAATAAIAARQSESEGDAASTDAGSDERPSTASSLAARMTEGDEGIDEGAMRRLLASLSGNTGSQSTAPPTDSSVAVAQKGVRGHELPVAPTHLNALPTAAAPVKETPATAADRLLRELKFDRVPEGTAQAPVAPTHASTLQPQVAAASTATNDTPTLQLQTPMQNRAEWANNLGERISWMTANNQQSAHIRLNPAHLGPIEVQVSVAGDQTTVSFTAHHAATREALEAAAPRLREMLGMHGQSSVNVNINHQSSSERPADNHAQEPWMRYEGQEAEVKLGASSIPTPSSRSRALDAYA